MTRFIFLLMYYLYRIYISRLVIINPRLTSFFGLWTWILFVLRNKNTLCYKREIWLIIKFDRLRASVVFRNSSDWNVSDLVTTNQFIFFWQGGRKLLILIYSHHKLIYFLIHQLLIFIVFVLLICVMKSRIF